MIPAGRAFQSTYAETPDMWSTANEEGQVLDKVVSDYNASGNPGRFVVRAQRDGSFAVIGVASAGQSGSEMSVQPYLDTPISVAAGTRPVETTLELILSAVSAKTGIVGRQGGGPINLLMSLRTSVGATNTSARDLLIEVGQSTGRKLIWDLWFLPDLGKYAFSLHGVSLAVSSTFGQEELVPASPLTSSPGGFQ
ncbi:MAG: hypothetical protein ACRD2G_00300 [Terriglobia bacterium]